VPANHVTVYKYPLTLWWLVDLYRENGSLSGLSKLLASNANFGPSAAAAAAAAASADSAGIAGAPSAAAPERKVGMTNPN